MANVKQCDRCGEIFELDKENFLDSLYKSIRSFIKDPITDHFISKRVFDEDHGRECYSVKLDLCPKCQEKLEQWLKGDKE